MTDKPEERIVYMRLRLSGKCTAKEAHIIREIVDAHKFAGDYTISDSPIIGRS